MSHFKCSLDRFFRLKGDARSLYTEIAARLTRDKVRSLEITKEVRTEIQKTNFMANIIPPMKRLEKEEIIRVTPSSLNTSCVSGDEEWIITPIPEGESSEPLPTNEWKSLAISLIVEAGHDPAENYVASVTKELEALKVPIDTAQKLLKFASQTKITSVGGWVRTSGKALLQNVVNISNHPMYKTYELPKTKGIPASKDQIKVALQKMKEAVLNAREQETDG